MNAQRSSVVQFKATGNKKSLLQICAEFVAADAVVAFVGYVDDFAEVGYAAWVDEVEGAAAFAAEAGDDLFGIG